VLYEYVNRTLTTTQLWPWPNEARIKSEMCSGTTRGFCSSPSLTQYIWEAAGNPMPANLYGGSTPPPPPPPTNTAPTVSAGTNQTITLPSSATLTGSASDDGLPNPPGSLTTTWSKLSGPGTVSFGNASALSTTAAFSSSGTY